MDENTTEACHQETYNKQIPHLKKFYNTIFGNFKRQQINKMQPNPPP